jgi:hypothetical protein
VVGDERPPDGGPQEAPEGAVPASPAPEPLPPDPAAYDSPRAAQARQRGLAAPYIAGGRDPDPVAARHEERRYLRLLVAMVVLIVLSGFVLGFIGAFLAGGR